MLLLFGRGIAVQCPYQIQTIHLKHYPSVKVYGWSPEELGFQYPHLTMGQIHCALAYYWDHQGEMDAAIAQGRQTAERLKAQAGDSPFVTRMRTQGLLQ